MQLQLALPGASDEQYPGQEGWAALQEVGDGQGLPLVAFSAAVCLWHVTDSSQHQCHKHTKQPCRLAGSHVQSGRAGLTTRPPLAQPHHHRQHPSAGPAVALDSACNDLNTTGCCTQVQKGCTHEWPSMQRLT